MGYKNTINPSSKKFTISSFSIFLAYIFSESISLKYHCTFSLYIVIDFSIRESSRPSRGSFASTSYQSLDLPGIICYYHSYRLHTLPNITCYYSPTLISSFSIVLAYIFLESTSLKYHCTFSLYKVTDFTIRESPCLSKGTFCRYQLPVTWLTRHHLLLLQLPVTCFTRHYLLSLINPLDFSYQVTKYLNYRE